MAARRAALGEGEPQPARLADPLLLAAGTLTALPVPPPRSVTGPVPGRAMLLAPVVAVIPGGTAWLAVAGASWAGLSSLTAAVIAIGVLALTTRGLHLDGLADTADGLAASYQRDRALAVMRSGDTGPAGMTTVLLVVLLQVAALTQVLGPGPDWLAGAAILAAAIAGRTGVILACTRGIPAARPDGLGAMVAGSVGLPGLLITAGAAAAASAGLGLAAGLPWPAGLLAVVAALLVSGLLVRRAVRRFGGITGDVIGACVEAGTAAALLVLAAA